MMSNDEAIGLRWASHTVLVLTTSKSPHKADRFALAEFPAMLNIPPRFETRQAV